MKKLLTLAIGLFLFSGAQAATSQHIMLSKDMNQCVQSLDLNHSIHTERIARDAAEELLGGTVRTNPFLNLQRMVRAEGLEDFGCGKAVMQFTESANAFYQRFGYYFVFPSDNSRAAIARLKYFTNQKEFMLGDV